MSFKCVALLALAGMFLGGCSSRVPPGSDAFRTGYVHGCVTGYADAYRPSYSELSQVLEKDREAYANEPEYRAGWLAGYKSCYDEEHNSPTMAG